MRRPRPTWSADQGSVLYDERPFLRRLDNFDWLFSLAMVAGAGFALSRYHAHMNEYDKLVLVCSVPAFVVMGYLQSSCIRAIWRAPTARFS